MPHALLTHNGNAQAVILQCKRDKVYATRTFLKKNRHPVEKRGPEVLVEVEF